MSDCNFHVGQKVVCVNDEPNFFRVPGIRYLDRDFPLKNGKVYTIIAITEEPIDGSKRVLLAEIPLRSEIDKGFCRQRFRPVVERKTDISIFQAMLTGKKVEVTA